jgi:ABC-2 type transport system permease protein
MTIWSAIAAKDLRQSFAARLGWGVLAAASALLAWWFLLALEGYLAATPDQIAQRGSAGVGDLVVAPFLSSVAGLMVFIVPLLGMRSVCEERRRGTLALLYAAGAGDLAIAWAKLVGVLVPLLVLLGIVLAMPAALAFGTDLDGGRLAAGMLGLALLGLGLAAISVWCSSLAQHPSSAAAAALAINVIGWMLDSAARAQGTTHGLINYLAIPTHLSGFMRGAVASVDVVYFLLLTAAALALTTRRLGRLREAG